MRTLNRKSENKNPAPSDPMMTQAKFLLLRAKLEKLKQSQPHAASEVSRLAELGDFSENTEYQMAKWKLRGINANIQKIQHQLDSAEIIQTNKNYDIVEIGSSVTVLINGKEKTFKILGSTESDPKRGIISRNSPVGEALIGHKVGDKVKIKIASGEVVYEIKMIL